ncbi:non-homologous end-joining DNA ligase [Thermomonospora sp. CIF 1]|uniref:non-homologous end-joining DNA ligase n=1 Tax=Thermomonospora sp. CIF 1 TaxID=1916083 RepID=UPI00257C19BB|nr:non-homologous end-joining DNA ligase [Thermomonospora sp. CIF 1]
MSMSWPVAPMLAATGDLPEDADRWCLELKWDGVRVVCHVTPHGVRAAGRRGADVTGRYPELSGLVDLVPGREAVLDGEVVAFRHGRPSFERLQRRMHLDRPDPRLVRQVPVRYVVFDVLYLDGRPLYDLPYLQRRQLLEELDLAGAGPFEAPPHLHAADTDQVKELVEYTWEQRLEGVVAKRVDSPYRPGRRVDFWRKVKNFQTRDVIICGWKPGRGRREGGFGSLLLGAYDDGGALRFTGQVGTGFTDRALEDIYERLWPLRRLTSPYDELLPRELARDAQWVEPVLVGEVAYGVWTREGHLRAPSWRGLRDDKDPREVTYEPR